MTAAIPTPQYDDQGYLLGGPRELQTAWRVLAGGSIVCARALVEIAKTGTNESARVQAAKTVLEMDGFRTSNDVPVRLVPVEYDTAAPSDARTPPHMIIQQRLDALAAAERADAEIVDAVLVEPDD